MNQSRAMAGGKVAAVIGRGERLSLSCWSSSGRKRVTAWFIASTWASLPRSNRPSATAMPSNGAPAGSLDFAFMMLSWARRIESRISAAVTGAVAFCAARVGARMFCACAIMASFTVCWSGMKVAPESTLSTCGSFDRLAASTLAAARLGAKASA